MKENRNPRNLLKSWIYNKPRRKARPQQKINKSLGKTLTKSLGYISDQMNDWIDIGRNHKKTWQKRIEIGLQLKKNVYKPFKKRKIS